MSQNPQRHLLTLETRLARVRLFLCDVDGILTDASIYMGGPDETKRFHIRDGLGLRFLQKSGIKVGWISNRPSNATSQRAADLKIDFLHQSDTPKVQSAEVILEKAGVSWEETAYMGDDIVDLGMLLRVGFAATVPEGLQEVRDAAHYVTQASGGHGAVREVVQMILHAQGKWEKLVQEYSK